MGRIGFMGGMGKAWASRNGMRQSLTVGRWSPALSVFLLTRGFKHGKDGFVARTGHTRHTRHGKKG